MKITSMLAAFAIASMATTPVLAAQSANPASSLSLSSSGARAPASVGKTNKAVGGGVIAALIAAGVVAIVVVAAVKDDNDDSDSN